MGTNFHTAWVDSSTQFKASSMNPALASLDRVISYLFNRFVFCEGAITFGASSAYGLRWEGDIHIIFNRTDGQAIENIIAAGDLDLVDGEFAYADLSETDGATITMEKATLSTGEASNFITYNRIVLGYLVSISDYEKFFPVALPALTEV